MISSVTVCLSQFTGAWLILTFTTLFFSDLSKVEQKKSVLIRMFVNMTLFSYFFLHTFHLFAKLDDVTEVTFKVCCYIILIVGNILQIYSLTGALDGAAQFFSLVSTCALMTCDICEDLKFCMLICVLELIVMSLELAKNTSDFSNGLATTNFVFMMFVNSLTIYLHRSAGLPTNAVPWIQSGLFIFTMIIDASVAYVDYLRVKRSEPKEAPLKKE